MEKKQQRKPRGKYYPKLHEEITWHDKLDWSASTFVVYKKKVTIERIHKCDNQL